ncbi:MAG: hypothetical protein Q4D51_06200 [Eubacteriales bacterium]|nr:hypothetical protein [Eubacteriales bacterium]
MSLSFRILDDEGNIINMAGGRASNLEGNHYKERQNYDKAYDKMEFGDSICIEACDWEEKQNKRSFSRRQTVYDMIKYHKNKKNCFVVKGVIVWKISQN